MYFIAKNLWKREYNFSKTLDDMKLELIIRPDSQIRYYLRYKNNFFTVKKTGIGEYNGRK
jgi:hypothetical protein